MSLALLLALQAAAQAPAAPLAAIDFDLARVKRASCRPGHGDDDIVVCGRRPGGGGYDLEKWERVFRTGPLRAEKSIGPGAVVRAYTESAAMPRGEVSKRAMVGVRLKF